MPLMPWPTVRVVRGGSLLQHPVHRVTRTNILPEAVGGLARAVLQGLERTPSYLEATIKRPAASSGQLDIINGHKARLTRVKDCLSVGII